MGFNYDNGITNANYYYGIDNFGNINYLYDASGNIVVTYRYDAWGNCTTTYSSGYQTVAENNIYRYRGYIYDAETGFYWLRTRYYDPAIGRFINADSLLNGGDELQGYNMYAYCGNNPVMYVDPTGNIAFFVTTMIFGAVIGFAVPTIVDYCDDGEVFNGSVSAEGYIANTLVGGLIGGLTGGIASSTFTFTLPTLQLAMTSAGSTALVISSVTVTVAGAQIFEGVAAVAGIGIVMFART